MRVAFGADEENVVTAALVAALGREGHDVVRPADGATWADVGRRVAEAVADGRAERGVVCCWTGTGVSIAANRVPGVRAALCTDAATASGARRWNDANVLAMGLRLTSETAAVEMLDAFLTTEVDAAEAAEIAKLDQAG
ncbi:MAG: RpiB/LacA/LacB family sugar-phosphate isomerase [Ilumatobacteraceae bacterium]